MSETRYCDQVETELRLMIYDNVVGEDLTHFPLEFQAYGSFDQTVYNVRRWFKANDPNIGSLPEPFFSDFIDLFIMKQFSELSINADSTQPALEYPEDSDDGGRPL